MTNRSPIGCRHPLVDGGKGSTFNAGIPSPVFAGGLYLLK